MGSVFANFGGALAAMTDVGMLLAIATGVTFGIVLGALPGFGSSQSLALLFPLTFAMPAEHAIVFFLAV